MRVHPFIAECLGTFGIVFIGTGAIVLNESLEGSIGHTGIAVAFGISVAAMIVVFGKFSGAHLNPAVTVGLGSLGLFEKNKMLPFVISQLVGAFLASLLLRFLFPANVQLGNTIPSGSAWQSFTVEFLLSFVLMWVILWSTRSLDSLRIYAAWAIGLTVGLEAWLAGGISGASMNPARSISPSVVSGNVSTLWVYVTAPVIGMLVAALVWKSIYQQKKEVDS